MAKGDGSITKIGNNKYRVQISYGKDPITGKYQRATKVVSGTKAEARKVRDQMRKEREGGLVLDGSKLTFEEFSKVYLDLLVASGEVGNGHIANQTARLKAIRRHIGNMKLKSISPQVVEATLLAIKAEKTAARGEFRNSTLRGYYIAIKAVMQKAVDYGFVLNNPCDKAKAPAPELAGRKSLEASEASSLLDYIDKCEAEAYARIEKVESERISRGLAIFGRIRIEAMATVSHVMGTRLGLATGMRRGEVLGLLWECVDIEGRRIDVRRSLSPTDGLKEPKTKAGVRSVSIDEKTAEHLAKWKETQQAELLKIGIRQDELTPVCCSGFGQIVHPDDFSHWFERFRKDAGFPKLKFHELRHTQATLLLGNGVDVKTVQTRLGHSDASVTLNTYSHALPENDKKAANLVGDLLATSKKSTRSISVQTA